MACCWDPRFTEIRYLPRAEGGPQPFARTFGLPGRSRRFDAQRVVDPKGDRVLDHLGTHRAPGRTEKRDGADQHMTGR